MPISFKPIYLPYNDAARVVVADLAEVLGLSLCGKAGDKYSAVIASFLYYAQNKLPDALLAWQSGRVSQLTHGFSFYPAAGASTITQVRDALVKKQYLTLAGDLPSGIGDMSTSEYLEQAGMKVLGTKRPVSMYRINDIPLLDPARLSEAAFIDAQRPYVLVNKCEEPDDKRLRKQDAEATPRLRYGEVYNKTTLGRLASKAQREVKEMNAFWLEHPLTLPAKGKKPAQYYASATRIFHNVDMKSGGRWYGGWTSLRNREKQRLDMLIDGEAVCEIDLNASQPSLFSLLTGVKMNTGDTWRDAYAAVVLRLGHPSDPMLLRRKVKQVIVEIIGTGNPNRTSPADTDTKLFQDNEMDKQEYNSIRAACLEVIPALNQLNREYMNATGFLSYHEANILTETMLSLKEQGVVAYGVHDCVLVKKSDEEAAITTYRDVISEYALRVQKELKAHQLKSVVAVSIKSKGAEEVKLSGCYY